MAASSKVSAYPVAAPHSCGEELPVAERITEIAEILATGLMRLEARKSSSLCADGAENLLDCAGPQSGHPERKSRRIEHG